VDDPALGGRLPLDAQVVEIAGVPQRIEVAFQGRLIVNVAGAGEHAGLDSVRRDSAVPVNLDRSNHVVLLCRTRACKNEYRQEKTDRCGTTAGPASQQRRGSYLKMARNDENLSQGLMKAQLYGTHRLVRNRATRSSSQRWLT
jgi:hypothetical protein